MLATFGMGCFWHSEEVFRTVKGVIKTTVGFMGGNVPNPSYELVCSNKTGHAEVVQVEYNPKIISYKRLLDLFFKNHDPSTLNRQGLDIGLQYRSVIFYHNAIQKKEAIDYIKKIKVKIVTELVKAGTFYPAETYHQKYLLKKNEGALAKLKPWME